MQPRLTEGPRVIPPRARYIAAMGHSPKGLAVEVSLSYGVPRASLWRRRGEEASRTTAQIAQVDPTLLSRGRQSRGEVHCLVEIGCCDRGLLAHIAKDCGLGPGRDQGVGDPVDPDSSAAAIAAFLR